MARRTITIESFTLPSGSVDARVTLKFTLVSNTKPYKPIDGYRSDDNEGVVGVHTIKMYDEPATVDLTPNSEISPGTLWQTEVIYGGAVCSKYRIALASGSALSFPEFLALDGDVDSWNILEARLLPTGATNGQIAQNDGSSWQAVDMPAGGGDVAKTGTPLNDQVALWVNATTVEGVAGLTYDGALNVTGNVNVTGTVDGRDIAADGATLDGLGGGGGAGELSDLSDVGATTPTNRNALMADGGSWESRAIVEADISDLGSYIGSSGVTFDNLNTNSDVGTGATQVAAGNHNHTGVYEPAGVSASDITDATTDGIALMTAVDANPFTDANQSTLASAVQPGDVLGKTNTDAFTPTGDYNPATKKYVDDELVGAGGYNDEAAQDAVGGILTDSSSIDFTYSDATPSITATVLPAGVNHDSLSGVDADEHIDWTVDQGATNLHSGNVPDLSGVYEAVDSTILRESDVDDTPVNGATTAPISSNWANDHVAAADPHTGYLQESAASAVATTGAYSDLSGTPTIPTASDSLPENLGTASAGASADFSRVDHVHNAPAGSAADIDQYDVAARLSAGTGAYAGVASVDLTEETTPATGDFLLGWESGGALRKFDIGDLPSGGGSVDTSGIPVSNDIARFTDADTIEGRSYTELKSDLGLGSAADVATDLTDLNEATIEAAIDTLANLTSVQGLTVTLADAGANAIWGWDDVAGAYENLSAAEARTILNVEDGADVTDTANVTAAGALMDTEVDADIKTLVLPASTTISSYGATLVEDADAATARATLSVTSEKLDDFSAPDDNTDLDATTSAHGLLLKATAPSSGDINVVAIQNGDTSYTNQALFQGLTNVRVLTDAQYAALSPPDSTTLYFTTG